MSNQFKLLAVLFAVLFAFSFIGIGCSEDGPTGGTDTLDTTGGGDGGGGGSLTSDSLADSIAKAANDELADLLNDMINNTLNNPDTSFRPDDLDFTGIHDMYQKALSYSPEHSNAKFGAAFTGMMLFLQYPALNDLIDEIKDVADTGLFYPTKMLPGIGMGGDLAPDGVPLTTSGLYGIFPDFTKLDHLTMAAAVTGPKVSELQDILEADLLPRITEAISYLDDLIADPGFVFYITPQMQGDPGAEAIEIDNTDFHLFRAVLHALRASLNIFFSRNLDLVSYDVAGLENAIQQNSDFLGLRTGTYMVDAKADIIAAANGAVGVLQGLIDEVDSGELQEDDLIPAYASDRDDYVLARDSLPFYVDYFNGAKDLMIKWTEWDCFYYDPGSGWYYYNCTTYTDSFIENIDVSKFFDDPVTNPKLLLPDYYFSMSPLPNYAQDYADAHWDETRYWDNIKSIFGAADEAALQDSVAAYNYYGYYSLPTVGSAQFYDALINRPTADQFVFGWDDVTSYNWGSKNLYYYSSNHRYDYQRTRWDDYWVSSCYGWTANSYAEWIFPNPTLNGLLPNMTSDRIKDMILSDPLDWEKEGCDTVSIEDIL
ncbi:MAG: hypothetical protein P1R58_00170 [bacterium]|nr:hypothetical protein [bacterium]